MGGQLAGMYSTTGTAECHCIHIDQTRCRTELMGGQLAGMYSTTGTAECHCIHSDQTRFRTELMGGELADMCSTTGTAGCHGTHSDQTRCRTELHQNPSDGLGDDTRSEADGRTDRHCVHTRLFFYCAKNALREK